MRVTSKAKPCLLPGGTHNAAGESRGAAPGPLASLAARKPPLSALGGPGPAWPHGHRPRPGFRGCPPGWPEQEVTPGAQVGCGAPSSQQLGGDELAG